MGTMFVNLSSGRVLQHGPQQGFIPFKEWKIVVPSPVEGYDNKPICEWRFPSARAAAA